MAKFSELLKKKTLQYKWNYTPKKKNGQVLNRDFNQEVQRMANKQVKTCSSVMVWGRFRPCGAPRHGSEEWPCRRWGSHVLARMGRNQSPPPLPAGTRSHETILEDNLAVSENTRLTHILGSQLLPGKSSSVFIRERCKRISVGKLERECSEELYL